jgi:hypothetical protein
VVEAVSEVSGGDVTVVEPQQQQQQQQEDEQQVEEEVVEEEGSLESSSSSSRGQVPKSLLQRAFGRRLAGGQVAGGAVLRSGFSMGAQASSAMGVRVPRAISAVSRTGTGGLQQPSAPGGSNSNQFKRWRAGDPGPGEQLSDLVKDMLEVTAQQVVDFMEQHPDMMDQQILYLATPVRVKELHDYAAAATAPPPSPAAGDTSSSSSSSSSSKGAQGEAGGQIQEVEVPTDAAEAAQGYRRFVDECHGFRDAHLLERHPKEYGPDVPPLEPLMEEGRGLVLRPGQLMTT